MHSGHVLVFLAGMVGFLRTLLELLLLCVWKVGAREILASSVDLASSSRESMAKEISGLIEASVQLRSSVQYHCLTILGSDGWISLSQVRTIRFSIEGEISSSASCFSP